MIIITAIFIYSHSFAQTSTYYTLMVADKDKTVLSIEVDDGDTCLVITDSSAAIKQLTAAINYKIKPDIFRMYPCCPDSLTNIKALILVVNEYYLTKKNIHGLQDDNSFDKVCGNKNYHTTHIDLMINMKFE